MPDNIKYEFVECPYCHGQYSPEEIFIPNVFFGRPSYIERDSENKIIDILGRVGNTDEHYICDFCNKPFKIFTKLQFTSKPETKFDFDSDYSTSLKKQSLFLDEDNE